ncbi:TULIP family P47-like protein, partial [Enterococcus faecium]|nr:TULIP family P47-like protein [Enterococcus faecium]
MEIYDWDFVYVMTNKVVNQRLKNFLNQDVVTFVYQNTDGTNIHLDFKEWRIVDGGSNKLLHLALDVEAGTITGELNGSLNGICPEIEVNLDTLTQTTKTDVNIINLDVNGVLDSKKPSYYVIKSYMEELFNFNKNNIGKVLASLLYSPTEPWLTPVNYKFAYYAATNQEDEYFVTFAVVTERDISQLKTALDSN